MTERPDTSVNRTGPVITGVVAALLAVATLGAAWLGLQQIRARPGDGWDAFILCLLPGIPAVVFAAISAVMMADVRKQRAIAERRAVSPEEPWLWSDEWREGRIRSGREGLAGAVLAVFGAFFLAGGVGPLAIVSQRAAVPPQAWVFGVIFGVVGLALIGASVQSFLTARKYPRSVFEMSVLPGTLGGPLEGVVPLPAEVPADSEVRVELTCTRESRRASTRSATMAIDYWDEVWVPASAGSVPIRLTIPFDVPPSEPPGSTALDYTRWYLNVSASVPGVDYDATFTVPVFATPASDASIRKGTVDSVQLGKRPPNAKCAVVELDRERTVFALARVKGLGFGVTSFLVSLPLAWWIARYSGLEPGRASDYAAIAVSAGAAILAVMCGLALLTPTRLEIDAAAIRQHYGTWRLRRARALPAAEVTEIKYNVDGTQISAVMKDGRSRWLVLDTSGPAEAKWLAAEITRAVERHSGSPIPG